MHCVSPHCQNPVCDYFHSQKWCLNSSDIISSWSVVMFSKFSRKNLFPCSFSVQSTNGAEHYSSVEICQIWMDTVSFIPWAHWDQEGVYTLYETIKISVTEIMMIHSNISREKSYIWRPSYEISFPKDSTNHLSHISWQAMLNSLIHGIDTTLNTTFILPPPTNFYTIESSPRRWCGLLCMREVLVHPALRTDSFPR